MKEKVSRTSALQILGALMRVFLTLHPKKYANLHNFKHSIELNLFFDRDEKEMSIYWLERAEALTLPRTKVLWKELGTKRNDPFFVVSVTYML